MIPVTSLVNQRPAVQGICNEPEGVTIRSIYPLEFTPDNLKAFWEKAREHRILFSDEIDGSFKSFCEVFMSMDDTGKLVGRGLAWVVDDFVGVFYITHIQPNEATAHYTFFDGRLRGREDLTKAMLRFVFDKYKFRRLNVEIACYAKPHAKAFAEKLGFVHEGRKRKCVMYKGEMFDVNLYGLLSEELV